MKTWFAFVAFAAIAFWGFVGWAIYELVMWVTSK